MLKDLYPDIEIGEVYTWRPRSPEVICPECGKEWFNGYPYGETVRVRILSPDTILETACSCFKWVFRKAPGQWYQVITLSDNGRYWVPGIQLEGE